MPFSPEDATKHTSKADTPKKRQQWSEVLNSVLKSCMAEGGTEESCSAKAIMQANGVIAKLEDGGTYHYLYEIEESSTNELEDKTIITIDIFREGAWTHPRYGLIEGNQKLFNDLITNWKANVIGRDVIFDKNHHPEDGGTGIVKDLFIEADKLKAKVELTNFGADLIKNKGFRYFSPEYTSKYTNKETNKEIQNVLIGGALTIRPFLTNLAPIVLSEQFSDSFCQEKSDETKEELWKVLEEYVDHDEEKIKNIMDVMKSHMDEAMKEMGKDNGKEIVKSIISNHMKSMMQEIMDNMSWSMKHPPIETKSNY